MNKKIQFFFGIGFRCNSTGFLNNYNLRRFGSPFDYIFVDIETVFECINNCFSDFMSDIVELDKSKNTLQLWYAKNTTTVYPEFKNLLDNTYGYMSHNYSYNLINQNYLDVKCMSNNLYDWNRICVFHHHNITKQVEYDKIKYRYERFINILNKYMDTTALLHITRIVTCDDIMEYINEIISLKKRYNIACHLITIICSDNMKEHHYYYDEYRCLFIVKTVHDYITQCSTYETDNNLPCYNYDNELNIIKSIYNIELFERNEL